MSNMQIVVLDDDASLVADLEGDLEYDLKDLCGKLRGVTDRLRDRHYPAQPDGSGRFKCVACGPADSHWPCAEAEAADELEALADELETAL